MIQVAGVTALPPAADAEQAKRIDCAASRGRDQCRVAVGRSNDTARTFELELGELGGSQVMAS